MKQNFEDCIICGKKNTSSSFFPYSDKPSKVKEYLFFKCCNYFRQKNFLSEKEITELYKKDYVIFNYSGINYYKRRLILYLKALGLKRYIKDKDVLEIGSATGDFLDTCRKFHPHSLSGVELSKHASTVAKEKYGFDFINQNIDTYKTNMKFDTIFMFHVIEHLKDPIQAMKSYTKLLKKDGMLIMETPNFDSFEHDLFLNKWLALGVPHHIFLYSPHSFNSLAKHSSFKLDKVIHEPITITYPTQFYQISKTLTDIFYIPLFAVYELIYFISALIHRSGVITVYFRKK